MKTLKQMVYSLAAVSLMLGMSDIYASDHHVTAMDSNGNAVSIWNTNTFNGSIVQASSFDVSTNIWTTPLTISSSNTGYDPRVAVAANGIDIAAVAIWLEFNSVGNVSSLYGAIYSLGTWTKPARISTNDEEVTNEYSVSMNEAGEILATWASYDSNFNKHIRASFSQMNGSNFWYAPATVSNP